MNEIRIILKVSKAKEITYPINILATEMKCHVPLQDLLNHTVSRLLQALNLSFPTSDNIRLTLSLKYGFDGIFMLQYKQNWINKDNDDSHLFCSSLVAL